MLGFIEMLDTAEDKSKFEALYMEYKKRMYAVAWKILKNDRDAEDIVHETFQVLIENFEKIEHESCYKTWNYIVTIVKHKAINLYHAKKNHKVSPLEDWTEWANDFDVEEMVEKKELVDILAELIYHLPYPYKEVLYLQYYNKLSGDEIAGLLDKTPGNVRKISQRAKTMLREKLLERGIENAE